MIGQQLLHYQIVEKLGEGGMGVVYKAKDAHLNRPVAIKVLPPERVADPERKARFVREARAASALNHPNIITIHDIASEDGVDFMVMEYVEGQTLDVLIPRKGMRWPQALKLAEQVASALARAHSAGIVHRDLKPANIMVAPDGLVKVLDFGLAKLTEQPVSEQDPTTTLPPKTEEGIVVGTAAYMSPEQAQGKPVDARSDIFSFGAVLHEMLTGRKAFRRDSPALTLAAVLHLEPGPLPDDVPSEVSRLLALCLRKDPDRRYQHIDDVRVALRDLLEDSDSGRLAQPTAAEPKAGGRWRWAAAGVLALAVLSALWFFREALSKPSGPIEPTVLTSLLGVIRDPALSSDGKQVAFAWDGEEHDRLSIYLQLVGSSMPKQISSGPGFDTAPAFSSDGLSVAFIRWTPGKASLMVMPALGGPERVLAEVPAPASASATYGPFHAWFPDGKTLVSATPGGLVVTSVETGESQRVTSPQRSFDFWPALSPDGRQIAFVHSTVPSAGDLFVLDLTEDHRPIGQARRITDPAHAGSQTAWASDGRSIVYVSRGRLLRVDSSGASEPRQIPLADIAVSSPTVASRSGTLAYLRQLTNVNVWRYPLTGPEKDRAPRKWIASTRWQSGAVYSPDGNRIAFGVTEGSRSSVYTVPARGGRAARLEVDISAMSPSWSRDGTQIYFQSTPGDRPELWKAPVGGGPAQRVTQGGGRGGFESPDGRFFYFAKDNARSALWRIPTGGGQETQILPSVLWRCFSVTTEGIYFIAPSAEGDRVLQLLNFSTGKMRALARVEKPVSVGLSVSPDGRYALVSQVDESRSELMLVDKFR
jgi:serine/threonine protein kinase